MGQLAGRGAMIALYHDDPGTVPPDQLRADAAMVVPETYLNDPETTPRAEWRTRLSIPLA